MGELFCVGKIKKNDRENAKKTDENVLKNKSVLKQEKMKLRKIIGELTKGDETT